MSLDLTVCPECGEVAEIQRCAVLEATDGPIEATGRHTIMSMYLSNPDVRPIGVEPAEFIDFPTVNDGRDLPAAGTAGVRSSSRTPGRARRRHARSPLRSERRVGEALRS